MGKTEVIVESLEGAFSVRITEVIIVGSLEGAFCVGITGVVVESLEGVFCVGITEVIVGSLEGAFFSQDVGGLVSKLHTEYQTNNSERIKLTSIR